MDTRRPGPVACPAMIRGARRRRGAARRPYDLKNLVEMGLRFLPDLAEHAGAIASGAVGGERMPLDARLVVHLRLARLLRCPVCLAGFPAAARVAGLEGGQIDAALEGRVDELPDMLAGAAAWAGTVAAARGEIPVEWPPEARALPAKLREQVLALARLELLVHAASLLVVPEPLLGPPAEWAGTSR